MFKKVLTATAGLLGLQSPAGSLPAHRGGRYMPHIGKKEQERAKRCRMQATHGDWSNFRRAAPTVCQAAK